MDIQKLECFRGNYKKHFCLFFCLLALLLIALTVSISADAYYKIKNGQPQQYPQINNITVSGTGEVYAKADLAITTFSVVTEAKTVGEAIAVNTTKMNNMTNAIKGQGVEDKDLKTTSFNIYPQYKWPEPPTNERILTGYEVRQSLQVKIRIMDKIGAIIQIATGEGANEIGDLQLVVDKEDELKKEARSQAIEKAKTKAKELALQLGVKLGKVNSFYEEVPNLYYGSDIAANMGGASKAPAPQISTGENKIQVNVSINYEIR